MSHLSFSGKKWVLPDAPVLNDEAPLAPWLMAILNSRGILEADIPEYLDKSLKTLHDPALMADMDQAVKGYIKPF